MPYLISNLYEKAFTPYTARMAPKHFVQKPQLGTLKLNNTRRKKATEGLSSWSRPNCEAILAVRETLDYAQPQDLLHFCSFKYADFTQ